MTSEDINYWTHGTAANPRPHEWRYLGKAKQAYHCPVCQLRVSKADLKGATDA